MKKTFIDSRIFQSADEAIPLLNRWRFKNRKVVFTNGCFDLLHAGHADYLQKASDMGDMLVVGLNSDASVTGLKGSGRPVNDANARARMLASLGMVDAVILFDAETPRDLIAVVKPDVLVKGADYRPEEIAGHDIVTGYGGTVATVELLAGFSSSALIDKIKAL